MNNAIHVVGPIIFDRHFFIHTYPQESNLASIINTKTSIGGAGNLIIDLAKLDNQLPIFVHSILGCDEASSSIKKILSKYKNIDISHCTTLKHTPVTYVMNSLKTQERTFFFDPASNKDFDINHISLDNMEGDIIQVEYIGLIGKLMETDHVYGSKIAKLLHRAQQKGMKTSIDMVSKDDIHTINTARSALKYSNYCCINEIEAQNISGINIIDHKGYIIEDNIIKSLDAIRDLGVSTWVVIHSALYNYGLDCKSAEIYKAESLKVPKNYIKGTTGAGDAFLSGILIAIKRGYSLQHALKIACTTAACSLASIDGTSAMKNFDEVMELFDIYSKECIYEKIRN